MRRLYRETVAIRAWGYVAIVVIFLGLATAYGWSRMTTLPAYVVSTDGAAVIGQRGLTEIFAADSTFAVLGFAGGLVIGAMCWHHLRILGWTVNIAAGLAALTGGLLCWWFGTIIGPNDFDRRLALAKVNDPVVVDLNLHAHVALAAWPLGAWLPVLVAALVSHITDRRRRADEEPNVSVESDEPVVDDQGVVKPDSTVSE